MRTWSKRTKWVIVGLVVLAACLIAIGVWPRKLPSLASLPNLKEQPGPENRKGRFTISNTGTNTIEFVVMGAEVCSNGVWMPAGIRQQNFRTARPGQTVVVEIEPPWATNKWRGEIAVLEKKQGIGDFTARLKVFWGQIRNGAAVSKAWPKGGKMNDGKSYVTREFER